jgi:cellulose synthase/poly-beta-1,6-N-acetylglucosamine synthase-like glycosyltransferase
MSWYAAPLRVALLVLGLPAALSSAYLLLATLLSARLPIPPRSTRKLRFDVIVPAHNESAVITRTAHSLLRLDWDADRFRIFVVADNCSDDTAALARASGVLVLERQNLTERGKGRALRFAFDHCLREGWSDALVVVDADSEVSPGLLEAFAARIERGADAVQAHYGVLNPNASWRTRLITIAKGAFHIVRSRARERLRLSCGIRGNGWCVTRRLLLQLPFRAFSLTEDVEYGIDLGMAGVRVHYADEVQADGEMVSNTASATKQRQRWEHGRFALIRSRTLPLLRAAIRTRNRVKLDLALDLMVLPLSYLVVNVGAFILVAWLAWLLDPASRSPLVAAGACAGALAVYVLRGWQLSGTGLRGLADLLWTPVFLVWKIASMLSRNKPKEWVRTDREQP